MNDQIVTNLLQRQMRMEQVRSGFEDAMQTAFNYVNPRRYDLARGSVRGAARKTKMYDGVAQDAFYTWVAGMLGWGVSENLNWHRAAISDRRFRNIDAVQRWLDEFTEQMDWEFRQSNFYDCMPEQLQDAASGGTAVTLTEESKDLSKCVHRVPHPGCYWVAENSEGDVDIYHEIVTLTARKAVEKFDKAGDTLHPIVRQWAQDPKSSLWECDFLHCICPADDSAIFDRNVTVGRKKYACVTILYALNAGSGVNPQSQLDAGGPGYRLTRVEGFDYFPPTVWRFRRNSDEIYGFSPAMDVLSIIDAAQKHAYNLMDMGNFAARPMLNIPDEKRTSFKYLPGARNSYGSEKRVASVIPVTGEYPVAVDREEKIHDLIRRRYGWQVWNLMPMFQQKKERVQATEIIEARADQARLLTGQFNNFWRQGVRPTYDNVAYIAARAGRMPPAPNELQEMRGKDIVVPVFIGPLSTIQIQSTALGGLSQGLELMGRLGEILGRHIGPDEAAKLYAAIRLPDLGEYILDHVGFPQALMNDDETRMAIIAAREQRAAALQEAQTARELAVASGQLGKEPGQNSLLARAVA
jgi:hypothetical protein